MLFIRFLRTYALPYWKWYLLGLLALYGSNQLTVLVPVFIKDAIDALSAQEHAQAQRDVLYLSLAAIGIMVIRTLSRACFFNPGRAAEFRLKNHLFQHLLSLPQSFHDTTKSGDLMSRATNDLQNVRALIGFAGLQVFEALFLLPLMLYQMLKLNTALTMSNGMLLLLAMGLLSISARAIMELMKVNLEQLSLLSQHILDTYSAMPVVQGFAATETFRQKFDHYNDKYVNTSLKMGALRVFLMPLVGVVGSVCVGMVLWQGGQEVLAGRLSVGSLVAYSGFIGILVVKLMMLGWTLNVIQRGMVALRRVYELLDTPPGLPEVTQALPPARSTVDQRRCGFKLEVRNLTFTYAGAEDRGPVLQDISFTLEPGQTLGIFGPTGSGKSSLVHLLARVYTPPPNTIFINDADITTLPIDALRKLMALVPQDPFLFSVTLRENIAWGGEDDPKQPDEARLKRSIQLACLESDLTALTQGLDTIVGARGITLSGGQRQRSALARAFYRRFCILLLDDVMAAVDHKTERQLIHNIYSRGESAEDTAQTTVLISHRLSALQHANLILVLQEGKLIDQGTHEELLSRPGLYQECWLQQQEKQPQEAAQPTPLAG